MSARHPTDPPAAARPVDHTIPSPSLVPTRLGRLAVRDIGPARTVVDKTPVVLWHSMFVDGTSWIRVLPALAAHRRVVVVDGPSHGASDPLVEAADIGACADAAGDLLDALDIGPVDWVGNAWGGHTGLHLAATQPGRIRRLVAISTPTHPITPAVRAKVTVLAALYRGIGCRGPVVTGASTALLTDATRAGDPTGVDLLVGPFGQADRAGMVRAIRTAILRRTDLTWAARRIDVPVLFVATDDRGEWTPAEAQEAAAAMTDARVATVHRTRVLPMIEQPEALGRVILDFWAEPLVRRAAADRPDRAGH